MAETTSGSGCECCLLADLRANDDVRFKHLVTVHIRGGGERKWIEQSPLVVLKGIFAVADNVVVAIAIGGRGVGDSAAWFWGIWWWVY